MDERRNPFAPGAGNQPPELAGRTDLLRRADLELSRAKAGKFSKGVILTGLRGVGKTVLLNRFLRAARSGGYDAVLIEAPEAKPLPALLAPHLRALLARLDTLTGVDLTVRRAFRVFKSFAGAFKLKVGEIELSIDPEAGVADSGDLNTDLSDLFTALGEAAASKDTAIALIIDEMQYLSLTDLQALIGAVHRVSQQGLPLVLMGAALPQIAGEAGRAKSYAERLFDYPVIGPLSPDDSRRALSEPAAREDVAFSPDALDRILEVTEGYPYFLQEWGYRAWNAAQGDLIDLAAVEAATPAAIASLDESFFRVRFDRLTPAEKRYLRAMAGLGQGPHRSSDIATAMAVDVRSVAPRRNDLIKKGMIYSPAHGDTAFTVPLFDQFMLRVMPDLD